jgi:phospholipid/cholesterol/gamma-HCH transport system substrate-binding protein
MSIKLSREFKVGVYIVVAIGMLYWGLNYLKGNDVFASGTIFYAVYNNTEGLTKAKAVQINGYQVGLVDEIYFHPDRSGRLVVKIKMQEDYPIAKNSLAAIHSIGFLGEKSIELKLGDSPEMAQSGDTLASGSETSLSEEVNNQVAPIKAKAESLLGSLDTAVTLLTGFLTEDTRKNFTQSFDNLRKTFENLENTSDILNTFMVKNQSGFNHLAKNLESISQTLASNDKNISATLSNINAISDSISKIKVVQTMNNLNSAIAQLDAALAKVNRGEGTLGELIYDDRLYENLNGATESLDRLLLDIKYNPNKYFNVSLFGTKRYYTEDEIKEIEKEIKAREKAEDNK